MDMNRGIKLHARQTALPRNRLTTNRKGQDQPRDQFLNLLQPRHASFLKTIAMLSVVTCPGQSVNVQLGRAAAPENISHLKPMKGRSNYDSTRTASLAILWLSWEGIQRKGDEHVPR